MENYLLTKCKNSIDVNKERKTHMYSGERHYSASAVKTIKKNSQTNLFVKHAIKISQSNYENRKIKIRNILLSFHRIFINTFQ